jgi:hypothetical protein
MVTYDELKQLVLARLDEWIRNLGVEAQLPRQIIRGRPLSPLDMRREVQMGTEIGTEIIAMEARKMGYVIG